MELPVKKPRAQAEAQLEPCWAWAFEFSEPGPTQAQPGLSQH